MNKDFIEIVRAAKAGDNRAFEALYNMTKDSAYFIALSITKNEQDALDIMQDSYIKAFESIETLNAPELFNNWMGRIVANTSKNYINKKKPILFADMGGDNYAEWNEEELNKDYLPHESVDTKETSRLLMEIINGLSEDKRLCVLMYYYQDMSVKEISEALELPVSTVKYKLVSARAEIKKGVEDLEKRGTKIYGLFPFALFPVQFKNIETEFFKSHTSPQYSSLKASARSAPTHSVTAENVTSKAVKSSAKKGFFSTVAGKITVAIIAAAVVSGGIVAAVLATNNTNGNNNSNKLTASGSTQTSQDGKSDDTPTSGDSSNSVNINDLGLFDYAVEIDGVVYNLPCDLSEFEKNGWHMNDNSKEQYDWVLKDRVLKPDDCSPSFGLTKDEYDESFAPIGVAFVNTGSENVLIKDCLKVGCIAVNIKVKSEQKIPDIKFPGGLTIDQKTTSEDIIDKYGKSDYYYRDTGGVIMEYWNKEGQRPGIFNFMLDSETTDELKRKSSYFNPQNHFTINYSDHSYYKDDE